MKLNPYDMMQVENRNSKGFGTNIITKNPSNPLKGMFNKQSTSKMSAVEKALNFRQISLDTDEVKSVNEFVKEAKGTLNEKLDTIEIANNKGIEMTTNNLKSLHVALNDKLTIDQDMINQFSEEEKVSSEDIKKISEETPLDETIKGTKGVTKENLKKMDSQDQASDYDKLKEKLKSAINDLDVSDAKKAELIEKLQDKKALKSVVKDIVSHQIQARGEKANESILLVKSMTMLAKKADLPESEVQLMLDNINEALDEVIQLFKDEMAGENAFDVELSSHSLIEDIYEEQDAQLVEWMMSIAEIKLYMVTEVTEEMAKVKESFDQFQNETVASIKELIGAVENLKMIHQTGTNKSVNPIEQRQRVQEESIQKDQVKQYMSKLIKNMNRTIMRTSLTLYTDMRTEKALLKMSTELEKAQSLLEKDKINEGLKMIKEVGKAISDIKFNPERQKIKAVAREKVKETLDMLKGEERAKEQKSQVVEKQLLMPENLAGENAKAKAVLEMVRQWGLNNEVELAKAFDKNVDPKFSEFASDNIKQILLKMADEALEKRQVENIENALMNLNGQQMLNDENPKKNGQQSKYFNLPYQKGHKIKNMKVFMNGQEKNASMDYNNCKLYFGIETDKFGPVGMKLVTVNGKLNFEIHSEDKAHETFLKEVVSKKMKSLEDCGFEAGDIQYKPMLEAQQTLEGKSLLKTNEIKRHQVMMKNEGHPSLQNKIDVQL